MRKSIFHKDYEVFLELLRAARAHAGITQVDLAKRLGATQSHVSMCESGERRIDIVQLRWWCNALGVPLGTLAAQFEERVSPQSAKKR